MKTGFNNAFVNIPGTKYYKYHGIMMPCNVQPDPPPFEDVPNDFDECYWEIWKDFSWYSAGNMYVRYLPADFHPSSDDDPCNPKFYDGKARYYFCELSLYCYYPWYGVTIFYNDGLNCKFSSEGALAGYRYKAWFNRLYAAYTPVMGTGPAGPGSHVTIWRTVCGEFNPKWPVPPT